MGTQAHNNIRSNQMARRLTIFLFSSLFFDVPSSMSKGRHRMASMRLHRELKRRQMGHLGHPGMEEVYTDKDRAAAVTMGDQDIKTSLKVKQMNERRVLLPEDMDSNIYLTEAQKNITVGHLEIALICANKAVENAQFDPNALLVRSRCFLLLGRLKEALIDAKQAIQKDPNLIKALLVQAEALYAMGEFERGLVLFHRGYKKRKDISAFKRGIQKSKEAILNAIGEKNFPQVSGSVSRVGDRHELKKDTNLDLLDSALLRKKTEPNNSLLSNGSRSKVKEDCPKPIVPVIRTTKQASKRLLGGLSSDKEFLSKLLSRKDFSNELTATSPQVKPRNRHRRNSEFPIQAKEDVADSRAEVASVVKEALTSLQHLEAFLWQRNPSELATGKNSSSSGGSRVKKQKRGLGHSRYNSSFSTHQSTRRNVKDDLSLKKVDEKVSIMIEKLEKNGNSVSPRHLEEAEEFLEEIRQGSHEQSDKIHSLCSLQVSIGSALQKAGRSEDSIALLEDTLHIAREHKLEDQTRKAAEWYGRILRQNGRDECAMKLWSKELEETENPGYRALLCGLIAKLNLDMGKTNDGIIFARKSFDASKSIEDRGNCLGALLMIATAEAVQNDMESARKILNEASSYISNESNESLIQDYKTLQSVISAKSISVDQASIPSVFS